jgi:hypothetical protein
MTSDRRSRAATLVRLTRNSDAGSFLETFLVGAVAAVLLLRWVLALTGYPQVGGGGLHIAHMLWGGLLMAAALLALLLFIDRPVQRVAALAAGIGFGIFIDEIGKFVTSNNDYFFQPAIALIYVIFVGLFLVLRTVMATPRLDARQSLANAMDLLEEGLDGTLDEPTRTATLQLLQQAPPSALTDALRTYLAGLAPRPAPFAWSDRIQRRIDGAYDTLIANRLFERAVLVVMTAYAVASLGSVLGLVVAREAIGDWATVAQTGATLAGSLLVLRGLPDLRRSRLSAYHWFLRGILVWLLVAQVFVFYTSQLAGVGGLAVNLVGYAIVRYMLSREKIRISPSIPQ